MRIRSTVEIEDPAAGVEPSNRERRIKAGYRRPEAEPRRQKSEVRRQNPEVRGGKSEVRRPAAVDYLASFLCAWVVLALLATGCVGPRPLKGGRAITTHKPQGTVEQTLMQGENPSQAS